MSVPGSYFNRRPAMAGGCCDRGRVAQVRGLLPASHYSARAACQVPGCRNGPRWGTGAGPGLPFSQSWGWPRRTAGLGLGGRRRPAGHPAAAHPGGIRRTRSRRRPGRGPAGCRLGPWGRPAQRARPARPWPRTAPRQRRPAGAVQRGARPATEGDGDGRRTRYFTIALVAVVTPAVPARCADRAAEGVGEPRPSGEHRRPRGLGQRRGRRHRLPPGAAGPAHRHRRAGRPGPADRPAALVGPGSRGQGHGRPGRPRAAAVIPVRGGQPVPGTCGSPCPGGPGWCWSCRPAGWCCPASPARYPSPPRTSACARTACAPRRSPR